jgi:hypothetical protein
MPANVKKSCKEFKNTVKHTNTHKHTNIILLLYRVQEPQKSREKSSKVGVEKFNFSQEFKTSAI